MARSSLQIVVDQKTPVVASDKSPKAGRQLLRKVIRHLEGILGGAVRASHITMQVDGAQPIAAFGRVVLGSLSAADYFDINGAAITARASGAIADEFNIGGSGILSATAACAAITASTTALIANHVECSNLAAIVTLSTCLAGTKLRIGLHEFTAVANVGAVVSDGDFSISGSNTVDGDKLVLAINAHPILSHQVVATNASGTVTIRQRRGTTALARLSIDSIAGVSPSGLAITAQFTATATILISALHEGNTGNAITLDESTSTARITVSGARATGGTGAGSVAPVRMIVGGVS